MAYDEILEEETKKGGFPICSRTAYWMLFLIPFVESLSISSMEGRLLRNLSAELDLIHSRIHQLASVYHEVHILLYSVFGLAEKQADSFVVAFSAKRVIYGRAIEIELTDVFGHEVSGFQFYN